MKKIFLALCLMPFSLYAHENLKLINNKSTVTFSIIKNGNMPVSGTFKTVSGSYDGDQQGTGSVSVDLNSLKTGVEQRDSNIKNYFFEVGKGAEYQSARFDLIKIEKDGVCPVSGCIATLIGRLTMHGRSEAFEVPVSIKDIKSSVSVKTIKPVIISVREWGFSQAIKSLMKVCGHKSLDKKAALSLDLIFSKK